MSRFKLILQPNLYNEREHNEVDRILGIVTTGSNWKFLTLEDTHVLIDYEQII